MRLKCFFLGFVCRFDGLNIYIYTVYVFSMYRLRGVDVCVWFWCGGELDVVVEGDRLGGGKKKRGNREEKVVGAEMWKRGGGGLLDGWMRYCRWMDVGCVLYVGERTLRVFIILILFLSSLRLLQNSNTVPPPSLPPSTQYHHPTPAPDKETLSPALLDLHHKSQASLLAHPSPLPSHFPAPSNPPSPNHPLPTRAIPQCTVYPPPFHHHLRYYNSSISSQRTKLGMAVVMGKKGGWERCGLGSWDWRFGGFWSVRVGGVGKEGGGGDGGEGVGWVVGEGAGVERGWRGG